MVAARDGVRAQGTKSLMFSSIAVRTSESSPVVGAQTLTTGRRLTMRVVGGPLERRPGARSASNVGVKCSGGTRKGVRAQTLKIWANPIAVRQSGLPSAGDLQQQHPSLWRGRLGGCGEISRFERDDVNGD